ncbi:MAG: hypothetical protein E6J62_06875 [Deltaproteobacteria bacterium]|nr:MAG: hypothetical protein E6J62_06875 [Deltaproteobacteria bacterium]
MSAIRGICGSASALLVCFAAACGGGGSSGQGGDFGTGLSIDTTTVSFSGATSEPARPASQSLHATISASDAASIEVGYANGAEQVSWLQVTIPAGQNPASTAINFTVTPQPTPGTYTAHPSVAIFKADRTPIALRALTVTYQVTPAPPSVSPPAITTQMAAANVGGPFGDILVKGTGTWTATVDYLSGTNWLRVGPSSSFPQSGPSPGILTLFAERPLSAGTYSATLHIAVAGQTFDVPISLQVTP